MDWFWGRREGWLGGTLLSLHRVGLEESFMITSLRRRRLADHGQSELKMQTGINVYG